ncbi:unnamed protein product, partial [marine sediment metagenome]
TLHVNATGEVSDYEVIIDAPNLATFRGRVVGNNDTAEKATDWGVINGAQIVSLRPQVNQIPKCELLIQCQNPGNHQHRNHGSF